MLREEKLRGEVSGRRRKGKGTLQEGGRKGGALQARGAPREDARMASRVGESIPLVSMGASSPRLGSAWNAITCSRLPPDCSALKHDTMRPTKPLSIAW